jgi:hypothetical protein
LGGGLFAVLIFWRYIARPFSIFDFSSLLSSGASSWVQDVIYLVLLAVCSYVLGHLVSYQSSYFIEGFVERTLGKFSKIVEVNTAHDSKRVHSLKKEIRRNIRARLLLWIRVPLAGWRIPIPRIFPTIVHVPMLPWYGFVYFYGFFDFADTRLPARMLNHAKLLMKSEFGDLEFDETKQWFRWVEYYTSYNRPVAASSMYNYLTISGLMRSLSYLFLISIWLEIAYLIAKCATGFDPVSHGPGSWLGWGLYFFVLYTAYITTATSYCKFFRRYVEEAVMGYLLEGDHSRSRAATGPKAA